jgi:flagellar basal body-associated protein FliL
MAETPATPETNAADEAPPPKKGGSKLLIGAFVSVIIIAETVLFFVMVPSGEDIAALAEQRLIDSIQNEVEDAETEKVDDENRAEEFQLGQFGVSFQPPGTDRTHRIEFRLHGTVKAKDMDRMKELFDQYEGRFRNSMILEIRNATMDELEESQLGLLRRRILATSTDLFGEPILLSVGFGDYQLMEL